MMKFKAFISEGVSQILFHHTTADKLVSILRDDRFRLGNNLGTSSDRMNKGKAFKPFFFSTSRLKYGGFARSFSEQGEQVNIVLDGQKLSYNLEGAAVDYWGPEWRAASMDLDSRLRNNENEDRLISAKPTIEKAHEYIKEIHLLMDRRAAMLYLDYKKYEEQDDNDRSRAFSRNQLYYQIAEYAQVLNLPIYFYSDFNSFKVLDKRKAMTEVRGRSNKIENIVELFVAETQDQLSPEADKVRYNLIYHNWNNDFVRGLDADIHNGKTREIESLSIAKLVKWMHKYRLRTTKDVVDFLANKWSDKKG